MEFTHPNSHLAEEVIEHGLMFSSSAFYQCKMTPERIPEERFGCNSLLFGEFCNRRFVAFVRITIDNEVEDGTGPMPGVLFDAATELDAEPHVLRIHMHHVEDGMNFEYFGHGEFIQRVRSFVTEWNARLIAPKTFADFHRMLDGRVSRLELNLVKEISGEKETMLLKLLIDGCEPYSGTISPGALLRSTVEGNEYGIFTCDCGVGECAGIHRGVIVVRNDGMVLWKAFHARGRRIFLFQDDQYRAEILEKCGRLVEFARKGGNRDVIPYHGALNYLEKAYFEATANGPASDVSCVS